MYKRLLSIPSTLCFLFSSLITSSASFASNNELVFLTWSEYIDPEIVTAFEKKYQAKIKMVYFETDDTRDDLLIQTSGKGYDLIMANGPTIAKYQKRDWLTPVTRKQVANIKHIDKKWLQLFEKADGYAVPYFWGTTGIVYRKDLMGEVIDSWRSLFEPKEAQHGKIVMIRSARDTVGMALKMLGFSANSENREEIKKAEQILKAQKPFVKDYSYIALDKSSGLITGDVYLAMAYSGDALVLKELNDNIEYVLPKEGGNIWVDYITVSKRSRNKKLAYEFINFINEPHNALKLAEFVYYATPNKAAEKLLPKDFLSDPVIYPSEKALSKSETYTKTSPRTTRLRNQIFSNIAE